MWMENIGLGFLCPHWCMAGLERRKPNVVEMNRRRRTVLSMADSQSELRKRLHTVKIAMKITRAMRLVSAARIKRTADAALKSQLFIQSLEQVRSEIVKNGIGSGERK